MLSEPLTDRELIVLRFLPHDDDQRGDRRELYVSVNTVKAHLKRIFRKLEVDSRREAVHRARELGLLSDTSRLSLPTRSEPEDAALLRLRTRRRSAAPGP